MFKTLSHQHMGCNSVEGEHRLEHENGIMKSNALFKLLDECWYDERRGEDRS